MLTSQIREYEVELRKERAVLPDQSEDSVTTHICRTSHFLADNSYRLIPQDVGGRCCVLGYEAEIGGCSY
ncbi:hypothetical protein DPMN_097420 [Dreissena polymorpha]|uniref:Uncharacterized protein n=1 Tax=Dreissena polymorpha TaxID=45954 RepID=A0A9D4LCW8_DREPO|nr:hypothetical protein DPMN_097420 [Dreissena polymorpha]